MRLGTLKLDFQGLNIGPAINIFTALTISTMFLRLNFLTHKFT